MINYREYHQRQIQFKASLEALAIKKRQEAMAKSEEEVELTKNSEDYEDNPMMQFIAGNIPAVYLVTTAWDLLIYIGINHYLLFADYDLNGGVSNHRLTADEYCALFRNLDPLAVEALLRKLDCPQSEFENLLSAWSRNDEDSFTIALKSLSCDLSGLGALCVRIHRILDAQCPPEDIKSYYSEYAPELNLTQIDSAPTVDMLDWLEKRVLSQSLGVGSLRKTILRLMSEGIFYSFENDIIDSFVNDPYVVAQYNIINQAAAKHERLSVKGNNGGDNNRTAIVQEVEDIYRYSIPRDIFDADKRIATDKYYVHGLVKDVTDGVEAIVRFEKFFQYILKWGRIEKKTEQSAMLTLLTGYYVQGAAAKARWCGDEYLPRILYHIVKHISSSRCKYAPLDYVDFYSMDSKHDIAINQDLNTIRDGSNKSATADKGIPSDVQRVLYECYPSLFPKPKEVK